VSNLAGFNNEVSATAAAVLGVIVFLLALKWPQMLDAYRTEPRAGEEDLGDEPGRISRLLVSAVVLLWGGGVLLFGMEILRMGIRYEFDWGYFVDRMSVHADFGRKLYSQMEFAYGPLLLDCPLAVRAMLRPLHVSTAGAYLITFVLEVMIGLLLVAYLIDHLPMSKRWRTVIFVLLACSMMVGNMGPNYTFVRFAPHMVFLVAAWQCKRTWTAALWLFAGQAACLGMSPEIGFAFLAGSLGFGLYGFFTQGRTWTWVIAAPIVSTLLFLLVEGMPYLHRVAISAHGIYSFPVEPIPMILVFLFALVWLIPRCIARFLREQRPEGPMLAALYLMSLALLPAGFGRADPGHVYWNGIAIFLLSAVAISSKRGWMQILWGSCLAFVFLWMLNINRLANRIDMKPVMRAEATYYRDLLEGRHPSSVQDDKQGFTLQGLQAIVGRDPVATPVQIPLRVERYLRESGQYTPSFYNFYFNVFDAAAEDRQIEEFNESKWALIPDGATYGTIELPENMKTILGVQFPYRTKRPVYVVGARFVQNLATNWKIRGRVGPYLVYEHMGPRVTDRQS
jgi:hypothetical protein